MYPTLCSRCHRESDDKLLQCHDCPKWVCDECADDASDWITDGDRCWCARCHTRLVDSAAALNTLFPYLVDLHDPKPVLSVLHLVDETAYCAGIEEAAQNDKHDLFDAMLKARRLHPFLAKGLAAVLETKLHPFLNSSYYVKSLRQ